MVSVTNPKKQDTPFIVKGDGTTKDLQQWVDINNSLIAKIKHNGLLALPFLRNKNDNGPYVALLEDTIRVHSQVATNNPLVIRGAASQTADLQQWQDSAGNVKAHVKFDGRINIDTPSQGGIVITTSGNNRAAIGTDGLKYYTSALEQTTIGAAGTASALPSAPTKYLRVVDSTGNILAIPAYASA